MSQRNVPTSVSFSVLLVFAVVVLTSGGTAAQETPQRTAAPAPGNLDLEAGEVGQTPEGWLSTEFNAKGGYSVVLTDEGARSGERCAVITKEREGEDPNVRFGNLMQVVDAAAYRGKRFRFRGWVRTESAGPMSRAQAWFRVDRPNRQSGFFDNMGDRPIVSNEWTEFEIVGEVADDAEDINFGVFLLGSGRAWVDGLALEILGESGEGDRPARALAGRGLDNLVAFSRLLGYVRYFHPTQAVADTDWDAFAIRAVGRVEGAASPAELAGALEELFDPIAPTVRVYPAGQPAELPDELRPPTEGAAPQVRYWKHYGVAMGGAGSIYRSELTVGDELSEDNEVGLVRQIEAAPYRGKRVRFRAKARANVEGPVSSARLALRVMNRMATFFHDEMDDRPITSAEWQDYEVEADVDRRADSLYVAVGMTGAGQSWFDDVRLEVVGEAGDASPVFEPEGFEQVDAAGVPGEWQLAKAGPDVRYEAGVSTEGAATGRRALTITGVRKDTGAVPRPDAPFRAELGGGLSCLVPTALYVGVGELPLAEKAGASGRAGDVPAGWVPSGNDRSTRLAGIALAWNVFQHFYPYFDVVGTDWHVTLRRSLAAAAEDADATAFHDTLRRLVADLRDGHGRVSSGAQGGGGRPAIAWDWVEERLVVTRVGEDVEEVRPGDVVLAVDGRPAAEALAAIEELISSPTPQWARYRSLDELARGPLGTTVELEIRDAGGAARTVTLERDTPLWGEGAVRDPRPEQGAEIADGVLYYDLGRMRDADLPREIERMAEAEGLVFDMRGYPSFRFTRLVAHLIDEPVTSAQWHIPVVRHPDRRDLEFHFSNWPVQPQTPRFGAKVAFLTDGRAISAAETFLGIIEHYGLGEIVGAPTAGTNGNVNPFSIPGGYQISWTGMRVLKHDGSQHHGVGIQPTVPVARTLAGVTAGRDEILDRALQLVQTPDP